MPGQYPLEEDSSQTSPRNTFNSRNVKAFFSKVTEYAQILILKPLIFILFVMFTLLSKLLKLLYFRDELRSKAGSFNDPVNKANKFIRDMEESLQMDQSLMPPFFQGSYTQALYMATNKGKFLFVYLTNPANENPSSIFNKVIIDDKFRQLFNDPNFLIWGGDLTNTELYQLANSLNVTKFPFLGLLALTRTTTMTPEGPVKSSAKISLLVKLQGDVVGETDVDSLIQQKFIRKIEKYEPELKEIRQELLDKFINQVFTKQQDLNYQKSLEADRLKKEKKKQEKLQKEYLIWKLAYFKNMNVEANKAKIAIKLPNGERVTQMFPADADIQDVFDYVELYRNDYFNKNFDLVVDETKFNDFHPTYKFKLMSPLPPKITLNDQLFQHVLIRNLDCIYPNGLLIVEDQE